MVKISRAPQRFEITLFIKEKSLYFHGKIHPFEEKYKAILPIYRNKKMNRDVNRNPLEVSSISTEYVFETREGMVIRLTSNGEYDRVVYNPNYRRLYMDGRCSGIGNLEKASSKN